MMTATLLQVRVGWLVLNSIVLVVLFRVSGLRLKRLWGDVRGWMIFMGLLFLYHGFFTPGRRIDYSSVGSHQQGGNLLRKPNLLAFKRYSWLCSPIHCCDASAGSEGLPCVAA